MAQKKQITLEDIYTNKTFQGDVVPGFSEQPLDSIINISDVKDENGKQLSTKDYKLSEDKKRDLVKNLKQKGQRLYDEYIPGSLKNHIAENA